MCGSRATETIMFFTYVQFPIAAKKLNFATTGGLSRVGKFCLNISCLSQFCVYNRVGGPHAGARLWSWLLAAGDRRTAGWKRVPEPVKGRVVRDGAAAR